MRALPNTLIMRREQTLDWESETRFVFCHIPFQLYAFPESQQPPY